MGRIRSIAILCALILSMMTVFGASAVPIVQAPFERTWQRTDAPVASHAATRTWMWGPAPFTAAMWESYAQAPGGVRLVQYFDKSRMEITNPSGDQNSPWYVTNGLFTKELITGQKQLGDNEFETRTAAFVNVAGDPDDSAGPTYATFSALLTAPAATVGSTITSRVSRAGVVTHDPSLAGQNVSAVELVPETGHIIARPFWDFMNASGLISQNGLNVTGKLFETPFYATGLPITEPYWANVKVGGTQRDVLMQCFERRCLTYTPSNPVEWQVEMGNVGQHYFTWRYEMAIPSEPPARQATGFDLISFPAPLIGDADHDGEAWVVIANQSPSAIFMTFDGPVSKTVLINACVDCPIYPPGTGSVPCMDNLPQQSFSIPAGNYRVTAIFVLPSAHDASGHWTLTPDTEFGDCWILVNLPNQSPAGAPASAR